MSDHGAPDSRRHPALLGDALYPHAPLGGPSPRTFGPPAYVSVDVALEIAREAFVGRWASTDPTTAMNRVTQVLAAGRPPVPNVDEQAIWDAFEARR